MTDIATHWARTRNRLRSSSLMLYSAIVVLALLASPALLPETLALITQKIASNRITPLTDLLPLVMISVASLLRKTRGAMRTESLMVVFLLF